MKYTVDAATFSRARKYTVACLLAVAVLVPTPVFAKDPCKSALCMWGLYSGKKQPGCDEAIQEHFDIVVYKKKKRIDWNSTAKQRLSFTNSCPGSDKGHNKLINDKYGKSSG
ncbi:TrbM/KikA/MpfK family conjugal transfer protein [Pseudomonas koreensis]|uniref:TrbM/KikA/MpfK family conjugal transfer protein n=1 Tax=Pseudomonas sp. LW8 TaxID=3242677 RepID=UPI0035BF42B5